jgi:hypothetical protein
VIHIPAAAAKRWFWLRQRKHTHSKSIFMLAESIPEVRPDPTYLKMIQNLALWQTFAVFLFLGSQDSLLHPYVFVCKAQP